MAHVLGSRGATVVAAIAIVTTTNTTLLALTAASRVLYGMAKAGAMPRRFAEVHARRGSPGRAIVAVALVAAAFAGLGDFAVIAAVTDFAVYVVFLAVNATVIVLRLHAPGDPASVRRRRGRRRRSGAAAPRIRIGGAHDDAAAADRHRARDGALCRRPGGGMADTLAPLTPSRSAGSL